MLTVTHHINWTKAQILIAVHTLTLQGVEGITESVIYDHLRGQIRDLGDRSVRQVTNNIPNSIYTLRHDSIISVDDATEVISLHPSLLSDDGEEFWDGLQTFIELHEKLKQHKNHLRDVAEELVGHKR